MFEYSFISFSDCDISHICVHFRAENAIRLELVGGVDNGGSFDVVRTVVLESVSVEVEESEGG